MTREELEHIIRASADITNQYEFVVIGSQSMLGAVPNPEEVFTVSMEADIYQRAGLTECIVSRTATPPVGWLTAWICATFSFRRP